MPIIIPGLQCQVSSGSNCERMKNYFHTWIGTSESKP